MCTKFLADETEKVDKYISGLPDNIHRNVMSARPKTLNDVIELANDLMDQKLRTYTEKQNDNKRKADDSSRNNQQQQLHKKQNVARCGNCKMYGHPTNDCWVNTNNNNNNNKNQKAGACYECGNTGHIKRNCPKLKNYRNDNGNDIAQGRAYTLGGGYASSDSNVITSMFLFNNRYATILFDTGADRISVSTTFSALINITPTTLENRYDVELADGKIIGFNTIIRGCTLNFMNHPFKIDLMPVPLGSFDIIIRMDWLTKYHGVIIYDEKIVRVPFGREMLIFQGDGNNQREESRLNIISCTKAQKYLSKGWDCDDEPSDDDDDDDTDEEDEEPTNNEGDDEEEEEHLAPANSFTILVVDPVSSARDTKAFETDESVPTPRSPQSRIPFPQICLHRARRTAPLGHRAAMIHMRDDIPKEDMPPRRRFILTAPPPRGDVAQSSAATAARPPRGQNDFVDTASKHRMMTSIEEVNLRISYQAQRTAYETELDMRQRRWLELLSDYDCDIHYHLGKVIFAADALSRKEWSRPLRVRALVMTMGLNLPKKILEVQTEALKPKNLNAKDVGGMLRKDLPKEKLEPRAYGTLCLNNKS
nr:hypothetical protein [Tanacetum cinerariifolium]